MQARLVGIAFRYAGATDGDDDAACCGLIPPEDEDYGIRIYISILRLI